MSTFSPPPEHGVEIMCDLETMGTQPGAPVTAIGAVRFEFHDDMKAMEPFYQQITLESCMEIGMRPSADTILWWLKQSDAARKQFEDPAAVALPIALDAFTDWLGDRPDFIWGNSARFDCGLLEKAYLMCGKVVPWRHWKEQCYRTMKALPGAEQVKLVRRGVHHNALDDAISQAHHLRAIWKELGLARAPRGKAILDAVKSTAV